MKFIVNNLRPLKLITGGHDHPFLPQLRASIAHADEIDFTVAFVKTSGLRLLLPDLHLALSRQQDADSHRKTARIRILTSDYLDVTDPEALRLLLLLQEQGAEVRVFETKGISFHMKAYLFARSTQDGQQHGTAFIGSSNISRQALTDGLEWNYRVDYPEDDGFLETRNQFETVFQDPRTRPLNDAWIDAYEARRVPPQRIVSPGSDEIETAPKPTTIQIEALQALSQARSDGYRRGLVVLATGLGKTWLAAFDAQQMEAHRVLFVAHREEILNQAAETRRKAERWHFVCQCAMPTTWPISFVVPALPLLPFIPVLTSVGVTRWLSWQMGGYRLFFRLICLTKVSICRPSTRC